MQFLVELIVERPGLRWMIEKMAVGGGVPKTWGVELVNIMAGGVLAVGMEFLTPGSGVGGLNAVINRASQEDWEVWKMVSLW